MIFGDVDAPGYAFRLWLPPGDATYLIRLESSYSIRSPIQLNTENAVFRQGQNSAGLFGWGLGLLAGLAMAALVLARRRIIRKRLTLAYVLILLTGCVHILADRGVLGAWWIALPGVQHGMLQLGIMLQQLSFIWFTLLFLHNRGGLTAAWHRILLALLGVEALALVLGVAMLRLFALMGVNGSFAWLIFAHVLVITPYVLRLVLASAIGLDRSAEHAAQSLGAGRFTLFRQITLPMILPGVAGGWLLAFINSFDEVTLSIFVTSPATQTLPVRMYVYATESIDPMMAAVSALVIALTALTMILLDRVYGLDRVLVGKQ